jgi:hypothetical protein
VKFLVPLAVFAAFCVHAGVRLSERHPHFSAAQKEPERHIGRVLWVGPAKVVETGAERMVIEDRGARLTIRSDQRHATGTWLLARGVMLPDGSFKPDAIRKSEYWAYQRGGIYGISAVVLAFFGWAFLKNFKPGLRGLEPKAAAGNAAPEQGLEAKA